MKKDNKTQIVLTNGSTQLNPDGTIKHDDTKKVNTTENLTVLEILCNFEREAKI